MRKLLLSLTGLMIVLSVAGCTPKWAKRKSMEFRSQQKQALFGIGKGKASFGDARLPAAKMQARANVADAKKQYVTDLMKAFINSHKDWFNLDKITKMDLYKKAGEMVNRHTLYSVQQEDEWKDKGGKFNGKNSIYVLMKQPLDEGFLNVVKTDLKGLLKNNSEQVISTKTETVVKAFTAFIKNLQQNPLTALNMALQPKTQVKKTKKTAEEKAEAPKEGPRKKEKAKTNGKKDKE